MDLDVWFLFKDLFSSRHESKYGRPSSSRINYNIIGWDNKEKQKKSVWVGKLMGSSLWIRETLVRRMTVERDSSHPHCNVEKQSELWQPAPLQELVHGWPVYEILILVGRVFDKSPSTSPSRGAHRQLSTAHRDSRQNRFNWIALAVRSWQSVSVVFANCCPSDDVFVIFGGTQSTALLFAIL